MRTKKGGGLVSAMRAGVTERADGRRAGSRRATGRRAGGRRATGLPRHVKVLMRMSKRGLPEPVCPVQVERGIEVPAADGAFLLTDHYRPMMDGPRPTLLVRSPYGRGFPWGYLFGGLFGRQGFHVVIQSCRGTAGSGGKFEPFHDDAADGHAAVAWLRQQDWFDGALGTIGPSYLAYTQWALAEDPPAELRAMVAQVGSDDFYGFLYPGGAFALESALVGTAAMLSMERGFGRFLLAAPRLVRGLRRVGRSLPLIDAYPAAVGGRTPFFEQWLAHPEPGDPFWAARRATASAELTPPVSLLTGWSDVCLDANLSLYRRLWEAGNGVRLTVGPWNHTSGFNDDLPLIFAEALSWLRAHLSDDRSGSKGHAVRVHVGEIGGRGQWRDLPDWPPADAAQQWHLHDGGTLATEAATGQAISMIHYDPAAPTPSVGGPRLDSRTTGPMRNNALEARPDVLVFTSAPLAEPMEVIGPVSIRVHVRASGPHFDVFARLCDVDARGRSWNICDGLLRLGGGAAPDADNSDAAERQWSDITVPMSATAHRFGAGHRLRVQISGGAHPRFARNTGTDEPLATATRLVPVDIEISHGVDKPCVLSLPGSGLYSRAAMAGSDSASPNLG
jgi:uncharacterized protein